MDPPPSGPRFPDVVSHFAVVVDDLETAMARHAELMGITWPPIRELDRSFRRGDGTAFHARLRVVYSRQGPPYLELIEAVPHSPWVMDPTGGLHHIALWSDHLVEDSARLSKAGAPLELTYDTTEAVHGFAYHREPSGGRLEIIDTALRPTIEAWIGS